MGHRSSICCNQGKVHSVVFRVFVMLIIKINHSATAHGATLNLRTRLTQQATTAAAAATTTLAMPSHKVNRVNWVQLGQLGPQIYRPPVPTHSSIIGIMFSGIIFNTGMRL